MSVVSLKGSPKFSGKHEGLAAEDQGFIFVISHFKLEAPGPHKTIGTTYKSKTIGGAMAHSKKLCPPPNMVKVASQRQLRIPIPGA